MKTAVIGMGNMGSKYAELIASGRIEGMELSAVTRMKPAQAERLKGILPPGLPIYESADKLFEAADRGETDTEAVIIVTPHYSHEDIAVKAFERNLHVLCDKPAGVYTGQAGNMEAAKKEGTVYGFIFQQRTVPAHIKLRELVKSGRYGKIKRVGWTVTDWYRPNAYYRSGKWRATWKNDGGGILLNQCPHNLDLLQWICGMPVRVQGFCHEGKYHPIEVEDDVTAYFEWENGSTGTFIASTGEAAGVNRLEISMDDGLIVLENGMLRVFESDRPEAEYREACNDLYGKPTGIWKDIFHEEPGDGYAAVLKNFVRAVKNGETLVADGAEAKRSLLLSNAIYLSSWENRTVVIPRPGTEEEKSFEELFERHLREKCKNSMEIYPAR